MDEAESGVFGRRSARFRLVTILGSRCFFVLEVDSLFLLIWGFSLDCSGYEVRASRKERAL